MTQDFTHPGIQDQAQLQKMQSLNTVGTISYVLHLIVAVSAIIPGARNPDQARANARASDLAPLSRDLHARLGAFYQREVAAQIRGPY